MSKTHKLVAQLALRYLPRFDQDQQLSDHAMTAWQYGAMALVAMGVAEERRYGCDLTVPAADVPERIDPGGLWLGDALVVLLAMASQARDLVWDKPKRRVAGQFEIRPVGGWEAYREKLKTAEVPEEMPEPMRSNMRRALEMQKAEIKRSEARIEVAPLPGGFGAHVEPEIHSVLQAEGYIADKTWTTLAQVALWRSGDLSLSEEDAERIAAQAQQGVPDDVTKAVEAVWAPPPMDDIQLRAHEWYAREQAWLSRMSDAARAKITLPTVDEMCETLVRGWPDDATAIVNGHVQRRWRVELGWDSGAALLPLFHDRLAAKVTSALVEA